MHTSEQQGRDVVHAAPVMAHSAGVAPHTGGSPTQLPLTHSKPAAQGVPSGRGAEVHTDRPVVSAVQVPWQQSSLALQIEPIARHAPGPGSHRPLLSHTLPPQHVPGPPE